MFRIAYYPIMRSFTSLAVGIFLLFSADGTRADDTPDIRASESAALTFEDLNGKTLSLHEFAGKVVVINLWASWCEPCIAEMASLAALQKELKGQGLVVLALSEDDNPKDAITFYKSKSITELTPYFDKGHFVWRGLHAPGIPTSVIINQNGVIIKTLVGTVDWQSVEVANVISGLLHHL